MKLLKSVRRLRHLLLDQGFEAWSIRYAPAARGLSATARWKVAIASLSRSAWK